LVLVRFVQALDLPGKISQGKTSKQSLTSAKELLSRYRL